MTPMDYAKLAHHCFFFRRHSSAHVMFQKHLESILLVSVTVSMFCDRTKNHTQLFQLLGPTVEVIDTDKAGPVMSRCRQTMSPVNNFGSSCCGVVLLVFHRLCLIVGVFSTFFCLLFFLSS